MSFQPTDISGLVFWVRSDAGVTKDQNNKVSSWNDQSGNNRHAIQTDPSRQPTWIADQLNGYPSIRFDAPNINLYTSSFGLSQPITLFLIGRCHRNFEYPYWCDGTNSFGSMAVAYWGGEGEYGIWAGYSQIRGYVGGDQEWVILCAVFNGSSSKLRLNRQTIIASGNPGSANPGGIRLGAYSGLGNYVLQGDLVEVACYDRVLSQVEIDSVENYLWTKYAFPNHWIGSINLEREYEAANLVGHTAIVLSDQFGNSAGASGDVIISKFRIRMTGSGLVRFKIFRDDGTYYRLIYTDDQDRQVFGGINEFEVEVPCQSGDYVGVYFQSGRVRRNYHQIPYDAAKYISGNVVQDTLKSSWYNINQRLAVGGFGQNFAPPTNTKIVVWLY